MKAITKALTDHHKEMRKLVKEDENEQMELGAKFKVPAYL